MKNIVISSAIAGLVALTTSAIAQAHDPKAGASKEKCYGIAKKGKNDCGTAKHSCSGQAEKDNLPEEWVFVAKGTCEGMKGSLKRPAAKEKASEPPKQNY